MRVKLGCILLLLGMLLAHQAACQTAADTSGILDAIADTDLEFGDELTDAASGVTSKVGNVTSKAAGTVANATSTAATTAANATSKAAASIANKAAPAVVAAATSKSVMHITPLDCLTSCLQFLAVSEVLPVTDTSAGKLEGKELDEAVKENADAQAYKEDASVKVVAQVVDQEPAAELANGDADLSTTGESQTRCRLSLRPCFFAGMVTASTCQC